MEFVYKSHIKDCTGNLICGGDFLLVWFLGVFFDPVKSCWFVLVFVVFCCCLFVLLVFWIFWGGGEGVVVLVVFFFFY